MINYYAGIGSRETPVEVMQKMKDIASKLEELNYVLRSGGANGADTAFEIGVEKWTMKDIYLPFPNFNGRQSNKSCLYIEFGDPDFDKAYESLKYHPKKFNMGSATKRMMLRNYFQIHGIRNQAKSSFVICWTKDSANGTTILTTSDTRGTGQAIRLAALENIPVYNLSNPMYKDMTASDIVDFIISGKGIHKPATLDKTHTKLF